MGERVIYGALGGGFSDDFPLGSQRPDAQNPMPPFRDMQNFIYHRGLLRPAWKWTPLDATTYTNPAIAGNFDSRQRTVETNAQYVVGGTLISTSDVNQKAHIVITDGEIFVNGLPMNPNETFVLPDNTFFQFQNETDLQDGTWSYDLFVGFDPGDYNFKVGDLVQASTSEGGFGESGWLLVVGFDFESFQVVSPESGIEGSVYTASPRVDVRRTFTRGVIPGKVPWTILNGDLYVACQGAGVDPAGTSAWCILKVADIFGAPVEAEYIMSTWDVTGSMSADSILPDIDEIVGLQASADGRLVALLRENGVGNRIRFSSFRDLSKWENNEEAGFVDLARGVGDGKCLCRLGEAMVAYFVGAIQVGVPTHQQNVPYTWDEALAEVGTRWYRAAIPCSYGNLYAGSDGHMRLFDGEKSIKLTDDTVLAYTSGPDQRWITGETISGEMATVTLSIVAGTVTVS